MCSGKKLYIVGLRNRIHETIHETVQKNTFSEYTEYTDLGREFFYITSMALDCAAGLINDGNYR
jgi:hypothetical protein